MASDPPALDRRRIAPAVLGLIVLCCALELGLEAADHHLVGSPRWRTLSYEYGAFWTGLLGNWRPNYPAQPFTMFLSYSVLHGGFSHLAGNMVMLMVLGQWTVERIGQAGFLVLWTLAVIGGGLGFGLLSDSPQPMVGASGALFGLVGAWFFWLWSEGRAPTRTVLGWIAGLLVLHLAFWFLDSGLLAWQTHLGGFVTGVLAAPFWRRPRPS